MFFLEERLLHNKDMVLPHSFFELVLPLLAPEPYAAGIYLYAYYLSMQQGDDRIEINSNEELAQRLGVHVDDVYNTWKFCEELNLIKKHILDEEITGAYSIEFRDLRTVVGKTRTKNVTTDELLVAYKNEEYKKMYDRIEQSIKYPLSSIDIKKIHQTISDYNISKDLVVEAVLYTIYKKKNRSIAMAMGVLRNWHLDGIRTVEDLEQMMQGKEKRYLEYKKILNAMGEYRSPTEPEREMMDMWLDEYQFDLDSILSAVGKTISIKNPNLKYVDGVLKNQLAAVQKMEEQKNTGNALQIEPMESSFEVRTKILELIQFTRKTLRRDEKEDLDELSTQFSFADAQVAYRHLQKRGAQISIANLLRLLKGETPQEERRKKITLEQVKLAEQHERFPSNVKKYASKKEPSNTSEPQKVGPIQKRLQEKRFAELKSKGEI